MPSFDGVEPEQIKRVLIISAPPAEAERMLNELWEHYSPIIWSLTPAGDSVTVTAVLLHESEIRKAQMAAARQAVPVPAILAPGSRMRQ